LQQKDKDAAQCKVLRKESQLFRTQAVTRKNGSEERYDQLLVANKLLFTADLVKELLADAYRCTDEPEMADKMIAIIDLCIDTDNAHFRWFGQLLTCHFEGIIAHASIPVSSGKIEGINNKIKTLRRQAYGYPDDDYFFLKIMDASRKKYVRNPQSHQLSH
ncbi:MAG: transposase, partial [Clostridia bacterium]